MQDIQLSVDILPVEGFPLFAEEEEDVRQRPDADPCVCKMFVEMADLMDIEYLIRHPVDMLAARGPCFFLPEQQRLLLHPVDFVGGKVASVHQRLVQFNAQIGDLFIGVVEVFFHGVRVQLVAMFLHPAVQLFAVKRSDQDVQVRHTPHQRVGVHLPQYPAFHRQAVDPVLLHLLEQLLHFMFLNQPAVGFLLIGRFELGTDGFPGHALLLFDDRVKHRHKILTQDQPHQLHRVTALGPFDWPAVILMQRSAHEFEEYIDFFLTVQHGLPHNID